MNEFNYTHLHLFDKSGSELPLIYDPAMIIQIPNTYNDDAIFYAISDVNNNICDFYKKSSGGRFYESDFLEFKNENLNIVATVGCYIIIEGKKTTGKVKVQLLEVTSNLSVETGKREYVIYRILDNPKDFLEDYLDVVGFPFTTFKSSLAIEPVSVDLVETQSIYILIEEANEYIRFSESTDLNISRWADRFKLLFFIDNRQQNNFRFFKVESDQAIWTDRIICDLSNADEQSSYRVDIGFIGEEEGVYEQQMVICLLDSSCNEDEKPGIIYPIGSITLTAEAIGEDERYRTLFANFGIPDPINYQKTFFDTDLNEAKIDYKLLNEHSKYIFLTYKDIFPKASSYGALAKAVSLLGYEDILFKEWYKEIGKDTNNEYITEEVDPEHPGGNPEDNNIPNDPIEERIDLKKLNWISIIYKLNEFLNPIVEDKYGFFKLRNIHKNYNSDIIAKLILLKKWLEKHIIGLHCKIVDVGGEGIYLERYRVAPYGTYQQVLEWNNSKNLAPFVLGQNPTIKPYDSYSGEEYILLDSSADLHISTSSSEKFTTIEEISDFRIGEFCEGYFDKDCVYHTMHKGVEDKPDIIYFGSTLDSFNMFEKYNLRAESKCKSFIFNYDYLTPESARLRIYDDELQFNPIDLLTKKKQSIFNVLPIIQLERANIRKMNSTWKSSTIYKIYPDYENDTLTSYFVKNTKTGKKKSTIDYVTLVPPEYREDDTYSYITPFGRKEYKFKHTFEPEVDSDNASGTPYKKYTRNYCTHGLRYTAMNSYDIPLLCMMGYVCPELDLFIRSDEEYCLEILDGKLIFEDLEHNRTIYVNFHFDTEANHQSIELNIVYYSDEYSIVYYKDDSDPINIQGLLDGKLRSHFFVGSQYKEFIDMYKGNQNCILYLPYHSIKVYNSGEFTVSVFARDIYNNLFGAVCKNKAYVHTPDIFINGYSNIDSSNAYTTRANEIDIQNLYENYVNFCIFKPDYLIHDIKKSFVDIDDVTKLVRFTYPSYSYSSHNVNPGDFLHFMNLSDRYLINAIDIKEYLVEGDEDFAEYNMIFQKYTPVPVQRVLENDDYSALSLMNDNSPIMCKDGVKPIDSTRFIKTIKDSEDFNYTDINFILYNELANTVTIQTPGNMINDMGIPYVDADTEEYSRLSYLNFYKNQYRLFLGDDSYKSYVWAVLETTSEKSIPKYLSQFSFEQINQNDVFPYPIPESEEDKTVDVLIDSFENNNVVLFKTSEYLIDLFKDAEEFTIPSSDSSTSEWSMEEEFKHLLNSLNEIISIDEPNGKDLIQNGLDLYIDGSTREDSSLWINPYFEIKTNLIKYNYDSIKEITINQIYDIFSRLNVYTDVESDEELIGTYMNYKLINKDILFDFEVNNTITNFLHNYCISSETILNPDDPNDVTYNLFLLENAIKTMQDFYVDENLLKLTIRGTIDALYKAEYDNETHSFDRVETCKNIFTNILNNFMIDEGGSFSTIKAALSGENEFKYNVYEKVLEAAESTDEESIFGALGTRYRLFFVSTAGINYHTPPFSTDESVSIAGQLQKIVAAIYTNFLQDKPEITNDPDNYAKYYSFIAYVIYCYLGLVIADYIYNNGVLKLGEESVYPVDNIHTDEIIYKNNDIDNIFVQYVSSEILAVQNESYVLTKAFAIGVREFIFGIYGCDDCEDSFKDTIISAMLKKELVSDDTADSSISLYNKLVINLVDYDINYLKYINWITTTAYDEDSNKNIHLYAVASVDPLDQLFYAKLPGYEREGYLFVNSQMSSSNSIGNLEKILDLPYMTSYIQPVWRAKAVIMILSNKSARSMGYEVDASANDDDYSNYMAIEYYYDKFMHAFNKGEMIKLIFESAENNDYIGQSSYEVVGYDISNKFVIVKGSINPAYIRKTGYDVWAKVDECEKGIYTDLISQLKSEFAGYEEEIDNIIIPVLEHQMNSDVPVEGADEILSSFSSIPSKEILRTYEYSEKVQYLILEAYTDKIDELHDILLNDVKVLERSIVIPEEIDETSETTQIKINVEAFDEFSTYIFNLATIKNRYEAIVAEQDAEKAQRYYEDYYQKYENFENCLSENHENPYDFEVIEEIENTVKIPYSLQIKYWWSAEDIDKYKETSGEKPSEDNQYEYNNFSYGTWYYQVMVYQNGRMYPIESSYTIADEMVNVYVSYAHNAYVDYILTAEDFIERPDGYTEVYVKYDGIDIRKCDFIDDTFALSIRDYDTNLGLKAWMNSTEVARKVYLPNILVGTITNEDGEEFKVPYTEFGPEFPLYKTSMKEYTKEPKQIILNSKNTNVAFSVDFDRLYNNIYGSTEYYAGDSKTESTVFWRIYKEKLDGTKQRLFESYNRVLFLDIDDKGTYDIEALVCDRYGNISSTYYNAVVKIV